ncbi:MAG: exodeoxyribonuclease V subunit gamma [Spirochaetes bacterium]|nr:MAG: exodeoxyribonuclease V subunit gamma [Spirochaetota bacterium]
MAGLSLYTGNRLEILAGALAQVTRAPCAHPFTPETIIVQSRGMERWLSLELAARNGIFANARFPFPNIAIEDIFSRVIGEPADEASFSRESITWKLMRLLPECAPRPGFALVRSYLGKDNDHLKRFQLATRLADVFDQYITFRPDIVTSWEEGEDGQWQAELWRALAGTGARSHRAARRALFFERLGASDDAASFLPERVSVFGIPSLPPFHMEVLSAISRYVDVRLFVLSPTPEFWADIRSDTEIARIARRSPGGPMSAEDLHLEKGNSLLASLGKSGREFQELVTTLDTGEASFPLYEPPGAGTMRGSIQNDIFRVSDPGAPDFVEGAGVNPAERRFPAPDDRSVIVNSCHSAMREVQVLRDALLEMFERCAGLEPRDVLVMTPDIEEYAPFIGAVLGDDTAGDRAIPFTIADRGIRKARRFIDSFFTFFDFLHKRFEASAVLDFLEFEDVRSRFGIEEHDIPLLRDLAEGSGVRWGRDAGWRKREGFPEFHEHSWRFGIERLLLGVAMPGREERIFRGILPCDTIEGSGAQVLGRFIDFCETLFQAVDTLDTARTLSGWKEALTGILDRLFLAGEDARDDEAMLRSAVARLSLIGERTGYGDILDARVVVAWLLGAVGESFDSGGFLGGGVTFSAMLPMRSIPFRVICLIGMNDGAFPRAVRAPAFDLVSRAPRPGDRSIRDEDRYTFLETLLSARETLYISYVGQSSRDNSEIPPSVCVSELLDYIDAAFTGPGKGAREWLVNRHPLQPFSARYFSGRDRLFSYSAMQGETCRARARAASPGVFLHGKLPSVRPVKGEIALEQFLDFFENPSRWFLTQRLGVNIPLVEEAVSDEEPMFPSNLDDYRARATLIRGALAGRDPAETAKTMRASGMLPRGGLSSGMLVRLGPDADRIAHNVTALGRGTAPAARDFSVGAGGLVIGGRLQGVLPTGTLYHRAGAAREKDRLAAWLGHCVACASGSFGSGCVSHLVCLDAIYRMNHFDGAPGYLGALAEIFTGGLDEPVPFFPRTSLAFCEADAKTAGDPAARERKILRAIDAAWSPADSTGHAKGDVQDRYFMRCFGPNPPDGERFRRLAAAVFGPMLAHQVKADIDNE